MTKICLIRQPAGFGDILFTIKIARQFIEDGYDVIWPVIKEFAYISEYIIISGLTFINENESFLYKEFYIADEKECIYTKRHSGF